MHAFLCRFIQINCLSFSVDDMYLVTSSSTETVHVFRLIEPPQEKWGFSSHQPLLCDIKGMFLFPHFPLPFSLFPPSLPPFVSLFILLFIPLHLCPPFLPLFLPSSLSPFLPLYLPPSLPLSPLRPPSLGQQRSNKAGWVTSAKHSLPLLTTSLHMWVLLEGNNRIWGYQVHWCVMYISTQAYWAVIWTKSKCSSLTQGKGKWWSTIVWVKWLEWCD